jgi:hypothetical protein
VSKVYGSKPYGYLLAEEGRRGGEREVSERVCLKWDVKIRETVLQGCMEGHWRSGLVCGKAI